MDVLLVEDDEAIAKGLVRVLSASGLTVRSVSEGRLALPAATPTVGIVLLDLGLPDTDGIAVCRELRRARPDLAILILTARDHEMDIVAGLDAGADDYMTKPFRLAELLARVRSHQRRLEATDKSPSGRIEARSVVVDIEARRVWVADEAIQLRPKEFDLLAALVSRAGRVLTRERLMADVWDTNWFGSTKTLDMHISSLRQRLPEGAITTVRGVGYRFEVD